MNINPCIKCGKQPAIITSSAIEYDDVVSGVKVRHHHHDMPMAHLKCDCTESTWHPASDSTPMINEWNTANPLPVTDPGPAPFNAKLDSGEWVTVKSYDEFEILNRKT